MCDQEKHAKPEVGMLFKNYNELETFLQNYTEQSKQMFIKGKTKPDGSCNIKKKTAANILALCFLQMYLLLLHIISHSLNHLLAAIIMCQQKSTYV